MKAKAKTPRTSSGSQDGFLFLGNHPVLDFLNTRPAPNGEPVELLPEFDALLDWFRAAGLLSNRDVAALRRHWIGSARAQLLVQAMRDLREKLRAAVSTWERGGKVEQALLDELNRLMADHPMRARLEYRGIVPVADMYFQARQPEDLFAPVAHHAAILFANLDRARVRKCDKCVLVFHDTSKKGTRRWCSMQLCGNRLKVAAYAARQRVRRPSPSEKGRPIPC